MENACHESELQLVNWNYIMTHTLGDMKSTRRQTCAQLGGPKNELRPRKMSIELKLNKGSPIIRHLNDWISSLDGSLKTTMHSCET